jgi:pimeloyl-ACP methyl ester carboxylesterase
MDAMHSRRTASVLLACALLAAACTATVLAYRADLHRAMAAVSSGSSIAATPCGAIEHAVRGHGPPILVIHGAGGGFDQGMLLGADLAASGYRVIAVSRFGYLRTPMPEDASAEAQADAHACLLDALNVPRAAIVAVSAGGPSALQLAIRHPGRVESLVLLVPLAWHPEREAPPAPSAPMRIALRALEHDFAFWAFMKLAPETVTRTLLATRPELLASASKAERERVAVLRQSILPVSRRTAGLRADGAVGASLHAYALERITAPTLVVSLEDDLYGTYPGARYTAAQIPGGQFVGFASGGHMLVGHYQEVMATLERFLDAAHESGQVRMGATTRAPEHDVRQPQEIPRAVR